MKKTFLFCLIVFFAGTITIQAKILIDSIPPGKNFNKALFKLWYPDESKTIRGIIVLVPGSNGDGRNDVEDLFWQELAIKHSFAIIGCYFTDRTHPDMFIENYIKVSEGTGQALLDVITLFARRSGFREMADAPLLLWGHSAGGQFNFEFVCWKPDRVIAFVVNKGGVYYSALASSEARKVPGILFTGEKDLDARKDIIKGIFSMNRRANALWAFAEEPGAGHEVGQTKKLAGIFFDEVIPLRIPNKPGDRNQKNELIPMIPDSGLIGDFKTHSITSFSEGKKISYPASWLPGERTANAWVAFIKKIPF
jgi:pimeloyl-ACP methyl ester carboxylesterase